MNAARLQRLRQKLYERRLLGAAHPLVWRRDGRGPVELWDGDVEAGNSTQRGVVLDLGEDATGVFGGNGSGKTELAAQVAMAMAMGDHPDAVTWAKHNGFPLEMLPPGGGRVIVSSLTHADSRKVMRPKLDHYAPPDSQRRNWRADNEAELHLPGGDGKSRGVIVCKANQQTWEAFQGDWANLYVLDEEHDRAVYNEIRGRIRRPDCRGIGHILLPMTPLKGETWPYKVFVDDDTRDPATRYHYLDVLDSPHTDADRVEGILAQYGDHEREARTRGRFVALEGLVYPHFGALHLTDRLPESHDPRFRGADFGTTNPTSVLWAALLGSGQLLIYQEHYEAGWEIARHAVAIRELDPPTISGSWGDPAAKGMRLELRRTHDLSFRAANNAVRAGINVVSAWLRPTAQHEGEPRILVHRSCVHLIRELKGYRWKKKKRGEEDDPDMPLKKDDHSPDALRYLCMGVRGWM